MVSVENDQPDFSRYVAIGDSVTSGYADGALFYEGQQYAYPNLISNQLQQISLVDFKQALLNSKSVGIGFMGNSRMVLKTGSDCSGNISYVPKYVAQQGDLEAFAANTYQLDGPFNNIAVPGAKSISLSYSEYGNPTKGVGNYNPFFTRMASDVVNASMLSDALALNPSFFSLFIGNNDVLAYALSGGNVDKLTPPFGAPGIGFDGSVMEVVRALTTNNAKGAIASLPSLHSIPYFTVVPYNGLLLNQAEADRLNIVYKDFGFVFKEGNNSFIIEDTFAAKDIRQAEKGDLILADVLLNNSKCHYMRAHQPIPKKYVLNASQTASIQTTINAYNQSIKSIAVHYKLAFVDVNSFIKTLHDDSSYNAISCSVMYKRRGIFSLDGVHLSPFGQALLANVFIKAINAQYATIIPHVNILKYSGILME